MAAAKIKKALENFQPFKVTFDTLDVFQYKKSATIWLKPKTAKDEILQLQKLLQELFPHCSELSKISEEGFTPHLTVGNIFTKKDNIQEIMESFRQNWVPMEFVVSEVHLIARQEIEPFSIRYSVPFGPSSKIKVGPKLRFPYSAQVNPYRFNVKQGEWLSDSSVCETIPKKTLSIVTYNVLFDLHTPELIFTQERTPYLLKELEKTDADLIALEEVTKPFLKVKADFLKKCVLKKKYKQKKKGLTS